LCRNNVNKIKGGSFRYRGFLSVFFFFELIGIMNSLMILSVLCMVALAIFFAGVLAFADKKLKVAEDPKIEEINSLLPGVNCGACGFLSCHDFAEHIVTEGADSGKCRIIQEETRKKLFEITGGEKTEKYRRLALIHCAARTENKKILADYNGVKTCSGANLVFGGALACKYGCIGFGDCERICPFGAIQIEEGLAVVDCDKCTGCGKCVSACPRGIIKLEEIRFDKLFYTACSSQDDMARTRSVCSQGCIACGICERLDAEKYFQVENNLSKADYSKQNNPEKIERIKEKCPTKVIKEIKISRGA